jgi:hypothetical protein
MNHLPFNRRHIIVSATLVLSLFISVSAKSQDVEHFKITKEKAKTMRDSSTNTVKAVIYSVADLKAILDQAATDEVQFQVVRKNGKMNLVVAIMVANPEPQPAAGNGPSANMPGDNKKQTTSSKFFDAGKICPPPTVCMIL